jgi:hypothetical protein
MGYIYALHTQELRNIKCPFCKKESVKAISIYETKIQVTVSEIEKF